MEIAKKYLPRYTYRDYKNWEGDWELIEGIPYAMSPSPLAKHQRTLLELGRAIQEKLDKCKNKCFVYPELDWIVDEHTVVRPDISILCKEIEDYIREVPEVIIEIVSESSAERDERIKFELYEREGVKVYILVYPNLKKVRAFHLVNGKYRKFFDSDTGNLEFKVKDCSVIVNVGRLF